MEVFVIGQDDDWRGCEVVEHEGREQDGVVHDPWGESDGIAIRTVTLTGDGELELSSVIEIFVE